MSDMKLAVVNFGILCINLILCSSAIWIAYGGTGIVLWMVVTILPLITTFYLFQRINER